MNPAADNYQLSSGVAMYVGRFAPVNAGTTLASIALTSAVGGNVPYTFGHVFAKGAVPNGSSVSIDNAVSQCNIQNRWDDGSAKIAVMSVRSALTAATPKSLTLRTASPTSGTAITEANLASFMVGKSLTVQLTGIGSVSLSDLIGTQAMVGSVVNSGLVRTRISGPLMSEFHYTTPINTHLRMFFYVRAYSGGNVWVRYVIHNGYLLIPGATNFVYTLVVTANGIEQYNASVDQKHHTRVTGKYWLGVDPQITPKHDGQYMSDAKLMPNYGWKTPTESAYTGLAQSYTPMGRAQLRSNFGVTGYDEQIGLFPRWEALYVSAGDPRAYNCTIASAESTGSYSAHYLDENTLRAPKFSDWPTLWMQTGDSQSVASATGGTAFVHDREHQVSIGYLAYLLTGDWYFMEEAQLWAAYNGFYSSYAPALRHGADCLLKMAARGVAWATRTLAGAAVVTPDDDALQTEFANSFRANMLYRQGAVVTGTVAPTYFEKPNNLGVHSLYSGDGSGDAYSPGDYTWIDAPWMQHFMIQSYGFCWDIEVPQQSAADRTAHKAIRDFGYKHVVGMLGDASGRPYPMASAYGVLYGTTATANELQSPLAFCADWAAQWAAQKTYSALPDVDASPGAPLLGTSGGDPAGFATGYWGNLYPAISYAVEHQAPGAADAYTRLTTASNYHPGVDTFNNTPQFGIAPRTMRPLPSWVSAVPLWQWAEIPNSALSSVEAPSYPAQVRQITGPSAKINSWNGAALKRQGSVYIIGAAGGHGDYAGNEVDAIALNVETPQWVELRGFSAPETLYTATPVYADLRRASSHVYWGLQFDNLHNRLLLVTGGSMDSSTIPTPPADWPWLGSAVDKPMMAFDLTTNDWLHPDTLSPIPSAGSSTAVLTCADPITNEIYRQPNAWAPMRKYDPATDTWTTLGSFAPSDFAGAVVDPIRKRILKVGSFNGDQAPGVFDLAQNKIISVTFGGLGAGALTFGGYPSLVYDEVNDSILVFSNTNPATVYRVNPETWEVDAPTITGALAQRPAGMQNAVQYVPELRCVVVANAYNANMKFMRVAP